MSDSEVDSNDMEYDKGQRSETGSDSISHTDQSSGTELDDEQDVEQNSVEGEFGLGQRADDFKNDEPEEKIVGNDAKSTLLRDVTKSGFKKRLEEHKGRSLYVRFAKKQPTDTEILEQNMKKICSYIVNVRRPRQTSTRFCLVDFATKADCDTAMKELKDVEVNGRKLIVQRPITEEENFEEKILERRRQTLERRLHWQNMKRAANTVPHKPNRAVSSLFIRDIPIGTTLEQLKEIFPKSIHMDLRTTKNYEWLNAVVTMASPKDAFEERQRSVKIGESTLKIYFAREFKQPRLSFLEGRFPNRRSNQLIRLNNKPDVIPTQSVNTKGPNKKLREKSVNGTENPVERNLNNEVIAKVTPKAKETTKEGHTTLNIGKTGKRSIKPKEAIAGNGEALKKQKNSGQKRKHSQGSDSEKKNKKQKTLKKRGIVENNTQNGKIKLNKQKVKA